MAAADPFDVRLTVLRRLIRWINRVPFPLPLGGYSKIMFTFRKRIHGLVPVDLIPYESIVRTGNALRFAPAFIGKCEWNMRGKLVAVLISLDAFAVKGAGMERVSRLLPFERQLLLVTS